MNIVKDEQTPRTKPACQLDDEGYFVGMTVADLSPNDPYVVYLIPGGAIDVEPPELKEGYVAKWTGAGWDYIENHIGEQYYSTADGQEVNIREYGPLPTNLTTEPKPSEYHSFNSKTKKWVITKLDAERKQEDEANAEQALISQLLNEAKQRIEEYQDLIDFADNDAEDKQGTAGKNLWRRYRSELMKYQKGLIESLPDKPE